MNNAQVGDFNLNHPGAVFGGLANGSIGSQTFAPPPPQSLMGDVAQRLAALASVLGDAEGELVSLRDRLFGAIPREVSRAHSGQNAAAGGQVADLASLLDALLERAASVRDESRTLNGRI